MSWFTNKPPIGSDTNSFVFMKWFQQVYRFIRGENRANSSLTSATNLSEDYFYPCDATSAGFTVTLPLASIYQYKKYCVKKTDSSANVVTIGVTGSDTIDGASTTTLTTQWDAVVLISDGVSKWYKLNSSASAGADGQDGETGPPGPPGELPFGGAAWLTMIGGGGGGGSTSNTNMAGGGGGSGEMCDGLLIYLTPGGSYSYSVGSGGASDSDGGNTSFGSFTCLGGKKGVADTGGGGSGGGARGGVVASSGTLGTAESATYFGGSSGGNGATGSGNSSYGGGSGGYATGGLYTSGAGGSGGGGGASIYDRGGSGSRTDGGASTGYGSGGGGAGGQSGTTPNSGGAGGSGYILITWVGGSQEYTSGSGTFIAPV